MNYIQLSGDERIILSCRTHWKNYIVPFFIAGLFLLFALIRLRFFGKPLILDLAKYLPEVNYVTVSLWELGLTLFFILWSVGTGLRHFFAVYTITTTRLILHVGFLNTRTTELKLCYCSNIILMQTLGGKILNYGDFSLRAGGVDMFFNDVPAPLKFKRVLIDAINSSVYVEACQLRESSAASS